MCIADSDQGPRGGHREINWESATKGTFTVKEVIEFAGKNDWQLADSITILKDSLTKNNFVKLKTNDYALELLRERVLPKLKPSKMKILIFKTNLLAVKPGNSRETFENGFAVLNSEGTIFRVYHFWGE